jgi:hypothetical protein
MASVEYTELLASDLLVRTEQSGLRLARRPTLARILAIAMLARRDSALKLRFLRQFAVQQKPAIEG